MTRFLLVLLYLHDRAQFDIIVYNIQMYFASAELTHWSRVTQICVGNLIFIGSDISLSPGRRQATVWANAGMLLIGL